MSQTTPTDLRPGVTGASRHKHHHAPTPVGGVLWSLVIAPTWLAWLLRRWEPR